MNTADSKCLACFDDINIFSEKKLLESKCGHRFLCNICYIKSFNVKNEINCYKCWTKLKKQDFTSKSKEDEWFEKENKAREYVLSKVGKSEVQFRGLLGEGYDYDEYLEEVEDIVNALTEQGDQG